MKEGVYRYDNSDWVPDKPKFDTGIHIVYFGNNKCGACRMFDPFWELAVRKTDDEKMNFWIVRCTWFEINCDDELAKKLFEEYDISSSPTIMIIKDGKILDKISGVLKTNELIVWIKSVLEDKAEKPKTKLGFYC